MTHELVTETAKRLRPFWGRVLLIESDVDEEQRPSGLIVPLHEGEASANVRRGVVVDIDQTYHEMEGKWADYARQIGAGALCYFKDGVKVGEVWIVDIQDILAYEGE